LTFCETIHCKFQFRIFA